MPFFICEDYFILKQQNKPSSFTLGLVISIYRLSTQTPNLPLSAWKFCETSAAVSALLYTEKAAHLPTP